MEYLWNIFGIGMEYMWNTYGIWKEYVRSKYGICMETCMEYVRNFLEYVWNI